MNAVSARRPLGSLRVLSTGVLIGAAAILVVGLLAAAGSEKLGYDFRAAYVPAAESVRAGGSPYPPLDSPAVDEERAYVYPPPLAVALVPFTLVPVDAASLLAVLGCLAALMGALAVAGLRDVRCYACVLLWAPGFNALEMANISALLALALAVAWCYRARLWPVAISLALAVAAKLLLWPLLIWAAFARGLRVAGLAAALACGVTAVAWAAIGFAGLADYPTLLRELRELQSEDSYSLVGVAGALGIEPAIGTLLTLVVGGSLLAACVHLSRSRDESRAFTCAIGAALALSPIVWQHYLVLLAVPLAISRPRFSAAWLLPIVLWVSPRMQNGEGLEPLLPALVAGALLVSLLARPRPSGVVAEAT